MKPQELQIAQAVLRNLRSEKYKGRNELFLTPFDLNQVPGYLDVVSKAMDLQTVAQNLESNMYTTSGTFWADVKLVFENAVAYHGNRAESKWIAKYAKEMIKCTKKEKDRAEKQMKASTSTGSTAPASEVSKKPKLKLKLLPTKQNKANAEIKKEKPLPVKAKPTQAKVDKPKKPKLKLKLSMKKSTTPAPAAATGAPPAASNPPPTAPTSTTAPPTVVKPVEVPASRGKELPKGVQANQIAAAATKPKKKKKVTEKKAPAEKKQADKKNEKKKSTTTTAKKKKPTTAMATAKAKSPLPTEKVSASTALVTKPKKLKKGAVELTLSRRGQAYKVIYGLKRRQTKHVAWFLQPVTDKAILPVYKAKVKHPMDIGKVTAKLDRDGYASVADVVLDLRRIFANCLIFNDSFKDGFRPVAVQVLETLEQMMAAFLGGPELAAGQTIPYSPLLFCWRLCIQVLDTLYNVVNPTDGNPTVLYFQHPVSYYCGGQFPPDYKDKISRPMDYGTVTANLLEARYQTVDAFCADCKLVLQNCHAYYAGRPDGVSFLEQANRLSECLNSQLDQLTRYTNSTKGASDRLKAQAAWSVKLPTPPSNLFLEILQEMRNLKYVDRNTKASEPAMAPFERPVNVNLFTDYTKIIKEPMDLQQIEKRVKSNFYRSPEDFEYDFHLIFKNCETYNAQRNGQRLIAMAKHGARKFRALLYNKLKAWEDPKSAPILTKVEPAQALNPAMTSPPPAKRSKTDNTGSSSATKTAKNSPLATASSTSAAPPKKTVPRITITAAQVSSATSAGRVKLPKSIPTQLNKSKADAPVPLHIAIARVKEGFPLRRAVKNLHSWEADGARYFKELLRHPWLSTSRPKFIFHVPVSHLFPGLREAYAAKIRKPMDLTTVECQLLVGSRYASPEDLIQDVALVFANAIRFNKDGKDIGDPLSCAYYDASVHLLRYSRWLSMELLSQYIDMNSDDDEGSADGLPPISWKLTKGNLRVARAEMENLVFSELIERSLEGDRWTWHEAECEKLLKALRHQSDLKYMQYFIQANYPADYTAYISKPMDWEKIQRALKKRQYDKFGDVVEDLRLIFSNALKYNSQHRGTDNVSGLAYDAANVMSAKLEVAINKMLLTASDRLERERIDHANAEREIEAAEKAEEEAIRAAWKKDSDGKEESAMSSSGRADSVQRIRLNNRKSSQRREPTDFEIPFFDDDEESGRHERSYFELVKLQKSMFTKQTAERLRLRQSSRKIGASVFANLLQRQLAKEWKDNEEKKIARPEPEVQTTTLRATQGKTTPSTVLDQLEKTDRPAVSLLLKVQKKKPGTKKKRRIIF